MTIRTDWRFSTDEIAAMVEQATGKHVAKVSRTSGLWVDVRFVDGAEAHYSDGARIS